MTLIALSISFTYFYTFWFDWKMFSISKSKIKLGFNLPDSINSGSHLLQCLVRITFKVIIIIDLIKWDAIEEGLNFNPYKTATSNFRFMSLHYLLITVQNNYRSNLFHLSFGLSLPQIKTWTYILEDIKGPTSCQPFTSLQNKPKVMGKLGLLILALAFKANQIAAVGLVEYRASVRFRYL